MDFVVTESGTRAALGFNSNENRCNVAMTRAKEALIVLLPAVIRDGLNKANDDGSTKTEPFLVDYMRSATKKEIIREISGEVFEECVQFDWFTAEESSASEEQATNIPDSWAEETDTIPVYSLDPIPSDSSSYHGFCGNFLSRLVNLQCLRRLDAAHD